MAFTYDITTDIGKVRFLISDTVDSGHQFEDAEIQAMLDLYNGSIYYAAAACLDRLAAKYSLNATSQSVKIGDYQYSGSQAAQQYRDMARNYREVEDNYPAFAIAEENLSGFNELTIIKNYVLRNEVD